MALFEVLVKGTMRLPGDDILQLQRSINKLPKDDLEEFVREHLVKAERISLRDHARPGGD